MLVPGEDIVMSSAATSSKKKTAQRNAVRNADRAARKAIEQADQPSLSAGFSRFASQVAHAAGKPVTFALAVSIILVWAATGPIFHYSDTWQLIINTGTTIVTFLMVFLIQSTQNRDGAALQAKLDELIRAHQDARDAYMGIDRLTDAQVEEMRNDAEETARIEEAQKGRGDPKAA
jgi:low affinity Fe/Cu permease